MQLKKQYNFMHIRRDVCFFFFLMLLLLKQYKRTDKLYLHSEKIMIFKLGLHLNYFERFLSGFYFLIALNGFTKYRVSFLKVGIGYSV